MVCYDDGLGAGKSLLALKTTDATSEECSLWVYQCNSLVRVYVYSTFNLGIGILSVKGDSKTQGPCEGFLAEGGLLNLKKKIKKDKCALAEEGRKALLTSFDQRWRKIPTFPQIADECTCPRKLFAI